MKCIIKVTTYKCNGTLFIETKRGENQRKYYTKARDFV